MILRHNVSITITLLDLPGNGSSGTVTLDIREATAREVLEWFALPLDMLHAQATDDEPPKGSA